MFLKDYWYVAAISDEIAHEPLARTLLNEAVVLYRTDDGAVRALEDRCCHRHLPLSLGKVIGDRLQCGYHGLEYDAAGLCCKPAVGVSQIRTTTVLSSCFCAGQTVL